MSGLFPASWTVLISTLHSIKTSYMLWHHTSCIQNRFAPIYRLVGTLTLFICCVAFISMHFSSAFYIPARCCATVNIGRNSPNEYIFSIRFCHFIHFTSFFVFYGFPHRFVFLYGLSFRFCFVLKQLCLFAALLQSFFTNCFFCQLISFIFHQLTYLRH